MLASGIFPMALGGSFLPTLQRGQLWLREVSTLKVTQLVGGWSS